MNKRPPKNEERVSPGVLDLQGVYFLGVDTTCLMSIITPSYKRVEENLTKVPRVRLRSGPILTAKKPRKNREASDLPDMEKNYKKFLSQQ